MTSRLFITRFNGQRALFVTARAKLGATIFDVMANVRMQVDKFEPRLPPEIKLERGFDQSETVAHRLSSLGRDFAIAIALVLLTLLPLGFRASMVVMVSIPVSFAIGVIALDMLGYSLNQLSIAGFVLALGLLVDDSIVVTENIARHLRSGLSPRDAAIAGVEEINVAVLGCTATLLFAFVPLLNLPEAAGDFTRSLPMAVVCTIAASLFVALTVIPFLASRMLPRKSHSNVFLDVVMGAIHAIYRPILKVALGMPRMTVIAGLALFAASLTLVPQSRLQPVPRERQPVLHGRGRTAAGRLGRGDRQGRDVRRWRARQARRIHLALRQLRPRQSAGLLQRDSERAGQQCRRHLCPLRSLGVEGRQGAARRNSRRTREPIRACAST